MNRIVLLAALAVASMAFAQSGGGNQDNPECLGSECGAPKEEGGGCGCGCGCSVWVAYTDDGKTLSYTDDADGDGKADTVDNCPFSSNRDQLDGDGDGVGNSCDNCAAASNFTQLDADGDGQGDSCDADIDGDGLLNDVDNCARIPNPKVSGAQLDTDVDGLGNVCDTDDDGDGFLDSDDKCPLVNHTPNEVVASGVCNTDFDGDNILDSIDSCPSIANPNNLDTDLDGMGDVCDADIDNDGVLNVADNCSLQRNRGQLDDDGDGLGDSCDAKYCVVIDPNNKDDCLDPNGPFRVHAGGSLTLKRGEKFRLPLFANRNGAAIEYTWTVAKAPAGSKANIANPTGAVSMSRHWEYAYQDGNVPSFTADVDGEFTLQLQAKLALPDRAYPENRTHVSDMHLSATPDGKPGTSGCSAIPVDAGLAGLGFAVLAMLRRRRS